MSVITCLLIMFITQRQYKWILAFVVVVVAGCWADILGECLWAVGIWLQVYACWRLFRLPEHEQ